MKQTLYPVFSLFILLLFFQVGKTQDVGIDSIGVQEGRPYVDLYFKLLENNLPVSNLGVTQIKIEEQLPNDSFRIIPRNKIRGSIEVDELKRKITVDQDTFQVLFLVDQSMHSKPQDLEKVSNLIANLVTSYQLSEESQYFLATYEGDDDFALQEKDKVELGDGIALAPTDDGKANLYEALPWYIKELNSYPGKKLLFLFSSGKIDIVKREVLIPFDEKDTKRVLGGVKEESFYLFPIQMGNQAANSYLESLPNWTSYQQKDQFSKNQLPENLDQVLRSSEEYVRTHRVKFIPFKEVYVGEDRLYRLSYTSGSQSTTAKPFILKAGSVDNPIVLNLLSPYPWWFSALGGVFLLFVTIVSFILLFPYFRKRSFMQAHVAPYQGKTKIIDPLTSQYIEQGELVVNKCQQPCSFQTWQDVGWQCPNYPDCMNLFGCDGAGAPESDHNFFDMQGIFRKLNWLWFGALGGFIGWTIYGLLKWFGFGLYSSIVKWGYQAYGSLNGGGSVIPRIEDMAGVAILGTAFGLGLIFALAWVEERGQSREISWLRILLRTLLGGLFSAVIFFVGFYFQFSDVIKSEYISTLLTWALFGLLVGWILSIRSSIPLLRGILGGLVAAVLAFGVYALVLLLIDSGGVGTDFIPFVQLLRMLIMGSILGVVLVTVVSSYEEYEVEYLSPSSYRRTVPISKWLKSGITVNIGTSPGSYIYVKWQDTGVEPLHAELLYENGEVYIRAFGEVLVGREMLEKNTKKKLRPGQTIQLGRNSVTKMRLKAKRTVTNTRPSTPAPTNNKKDQSNGKAKLNLGIKS